MVEAVVVAVDVADAGPGHNGRDDVLKEVILDQPVPARKDFDAVAQRVRRPRSVEVAVADDDVGGVQALDVVASAGILVGIRERNLPDAPHPGLVGVEERYADRVEIRPAIEGHVFKAGALELRVGVPRPRIPRGAPVRHE